MCKLKMKMKPQACSVLVSWGSPVSAEGNLLWHEGVHGACLSSVCLCLSLVSRSGSLGIVFGLFGPCCR